MSNDLTLIELDDTAVDAVSGAALPVAWAVGFGLAGVFGGGFTAGYVFGSDLAK